MDIQTRKLKFIQKLLKVQNKELISQLEQALIDYNRKHPEAFSIEGLNERIEKSEDDFKHGKFKTQEDLENQSTNW